MTVLLLCRLTLSCALYCRFLKFEKALPGSAHDAYDIYRLLNIDEYEKLIDCPLPKPCSQSKYGRVVYIRPQTDYRLFTKTPRGSKAWKKAFARRSSVERSIKRILVDYRIEQARARSLKQWF